MYTEWMIVFSTPRPYEAEVVKVILNSYEIECNVINKRDSELLIGEVEVYAPAPQVMKAKKLISRYQGE